MVKKMTWAVRTPQICLGFVLLVIGYVMFAMMNFSVFDAIKGPVELTAEMSLQEMEGAVCVLRGQISPGHLHGGNGH